MIASNEVVSPPGGLDDGAVRRATAPGPPAHGHGLSSKMMALITSNFGPPAHGMQLAADRHSRTAHSCCLPVAPARSPSPRAPPRPLAMEAAAVGWAGRRWSRHWLRLGSGAASRTCLNTALPTAPAERRRPGLRQCRGCWKARSLGCVVGLLPAPPPYNPLQFPHTTPPIGQGPGCKLPPNGGTHFRQVGGQQLAVAERLVARYDLHGAFPEIGDLSKRQTVLKLLRKQQWQLAVQLCGDDRRLQVSHQPCTYNAYVAIAIIEKLTVAV